MENVTVGHVQDVLEHAYPNSLSVAMIADSLRCSEPEVEAFLCELEQNGIATRVRNQTDEWLRVDNFSSRASSIIQDGIDIFMDDFQFLSHSTNCRANTIPRLP